MKELKIMFTGFLAFANFMVAGLWVTNLFRPGWNGQTILWIAIPTVIGILNLLITWTEIENYKKSKQ